MKEKNSVKNNRNKKNRNLRAKLCNMLLGMGVFILMVGRVESTSGPGKWPIIDLQYHADGEKIENLCTRMTNNGITPSTVDNVKNANHKYQYKFLWTAWAKLPTGMVMKRYDYDPNYQNTDETKSYSMLKWSSVIDTTYGIRNSFPFVLNDLTKFNAGQMRTEVCYVFDKTNAANCGSAKLCGSNKRCEHRCPISGPSVSPDPICNLDHTGRCKTVGTGEWFMIGADYTILEPSGGETCKIEFSILRASPNYSDSSYGSTDCSDFTDPLRLHLAFGTNRGDANSIITQNTEEIKLQAGYETMIIKNRASAFIVLDKNQLYVTGLGNVGADLEITLDDIRNYHQTLNFYIYLASGEPSLHKFYDLTKWDPIKLNDVILYNYGTDEQKKFLFDRYSTFGYPLIHPNDDAANVIPTGGFLSSFGILEFYKNTFEISSVPVIDFANSKFCSTSTVTLIVVREAADTLDSGSIVFVIKVGFKISGSTNYNQDLITVHIKKKDASNILVMLGTSDTTTTTETQSEITSTSGTDFKVDGQLIGQLTYPSTWPSTGHLEIMVQVTVCPVGPEKEQSEQLIPAMASLMVKDSESSFEKISARNLLGWAFKYTKITPYSDTKLLGLRVSLSPLSIYNNLKFYISNAGFFKGGASPTMIDKITTDTTTYPDYTFWNNHFAQSQSFSFVGGSRTTTNGAKNPSDTVIFTRCTNNNPLSFVSGNHDSCLIADPIEGCLKYRADDSNPTKGVCERCDEGANYWIDKSNPNGVCAKKTENPGVEVNCDMSTHNHYAQGECHTCQNVDQGCICNTNQEAGATAGTCKCKEDGCGICHEADGTKCQYCFPTNIFLQHPDDTAATLVCVDITRINQDQAGKGKDLTRQPPSLIDCTAGSECSFCGENAVDCTRCTGSDISNPAHYFSKGGSCVLQSSLGSNDGFGTKSTYEWRVLSCLSSECGNCYENYEQCKSCSTDNYLQDLDESSTKTTCTHKDNIPDGLGINGAIQKLVKCIDTRCQGCALDYEDCNACLSPLTDSLSQNGEVSGNKNKCQVRKLDPPPLENNINTENTFAIKNQAFRPSTSTIKLEFNAQCNKNVQTSAIKIQLFKPDRITEIPVEYLRGRLIDDSQTLALEIKLKENVEDGILIVRFTNVATFFKAGNEENTLNKGEYEIKNVNYYSFGEEKASKAIATAGNTSLKFASLLYYLVSTTTSLFLLKLFQMIDYLVFFNVNHPRNLKVYLGVMGKGPIEDIPNFFSFLADGKCQKVKEKFSDEGMTCQIFQSYGNYFMVILGLGCFKLLTMTAYHVLDFFEKDPLWLRKFHYKFMGSKFWLEFFDAIQLDLYLNAMLALTSYKGGSQVASFNFYFSVAMLLASVGGIFFLFFKIKFYQKITGYEALEREHLDKLFASRIYSIDLIWIKLEYKDKNWYQKYHSMHNFIRDPLLAICMVFLHDIPILQTFSCCAIMLFSAVLDSKHWPYREKAKNIILIISGYKYFAINLLFMILAAGEGKMKEKARYMFIGFLIIALISGIIFIDVGYATVEVWIKLKKWRQKKKKKSGSKEGKKKENLPKKKMDNGQKERPREKSIILHNQPEGLPKKNVKNAGKLKKKFEDNKMLSKIEEERSSQLINSPVKGRMNRKMKRGVTFKEIEEAENNREVDIFSPSKNRYRRTRSPKKSMMSNKSKFRFKGKTGSPRRKKSGEGGFAAMLDD